MLPRLALTAACLGAFACSPSVTTALSGTVQGKIVAADYAVFARGNAFVRGHGRVDALVVAMSSESSVCIDQAGSLAHPNATGLHLSLVKFDPTGDLVALERGTYDIHSVAPHEVDPAAGVQSLALGTLIAFDDRCGDALAARDGSDTTSIAAGGIKLEALQSGDKAEGTFELEVGSQRDSVTGGFAAQHCSGLQAEADALAAAYAGGHASDRAVPALTCATSRVSS